MRCVCVLGGGGGCREKEMEGRGLSRSNVVEHMCQRERARARERSLRFVSSRELHTAKAAEP